MVNVTIYSIHGYTWILWDDCFPCFPCFPVSAFNDKPVEAGGWVGIHPCHDLVTPEGLAGSRAEFAGADQGVGAENCLWYGTGWWSDGAGKREREKERETCGICMFFSFLFKRWIRIVTRTTVGFTAWSCPGGLRCIPSDGEASLVCCLPLQEMSFVIWLEWA